MLKIMAPINIDTIDNNSLTEIIDKFSQKLVAYAKRLRRYKECTCMNNISTEI